MSEKFCLKWNDFQLNISKSFSTLRAESYFNDVTIVCDDQQQLRAHKVILSSSSEYFRSLFKQNDHSHPLLLFPEVTSNELEYILDYIYRGEVNIFQEHLDRFLDIAAKLKLEGLSLDQKKENKNLQEYDNDVTESMVPESPKDEYCLENGQVQVNRLEPEVFTDFHLSQDSASSMEEINTLIAKYLSRNDDGTYSCIKCGKNGSKNGSARDMRNHIETHLNGISFTCPMCAKQFRSRNSFKVHKSNYHKN